ncbi:MAG: hypothetical protein V3V52_12205 [Candidatus Adiutricales bacterium]
MRKNGPPVEEGSVKGRETDDLIGQYVPVHGRGIEPHDFMLGFILEAGDKEIS